MHVDWEYLQQVAQDAGDWGEAELEELYQTLVGISKLRSRDKTAEKLEMLFTLTQAVMLAKHTQVAALEEELGHLAESAGRKDAKREQELQGEILRLQALVESGTREKNLQEEEIAYDWSSGWRLKKREMEESIHQKNMEIQQFMDDLQSCESERAVLRSSVVQLEDRLAEATREINSITSDYLQLKDSHKHAQEALATTQGEVEGLRSLVEELAGEKARSQQHYDELTVAVNAKVDQLQVAVSQREEELQNVKSQLYHRSTPLPGTQTHSSVTKIIEMEKELKEREEEVNHLTQQLKEASKEMDNSAQIIAQLKKAKIPPADREHTVVNQLRGELNEAQKLIQQMRTQLLAAEEDAQLHAQDLSTVVGQLLSYLAGEYSLADAVRELKEVRSQVRIRDSQLTQLTSLVNTLQININDLLDENSQLREQLNLEPREDIDLPGVNKTHWQDSKSIIERLTNEVNKLQDDKVTLQTKIYEMTRELSNTKSSLQLTTIELPKPLTAEDSTGLQVKSLEDQINHLSSAVGQLLHEHQQDHSDHLLKAQLGELKEKCLRLEGEKASLERIIQSDLMKRKKTPEREEEASDSSQEKVPPEPSLDPGSKSPVATLEKLVDALGHLPPSVEEVIAKLKNQVNFLMQECNKREKDIAEREKTVDIYTAQFEGLRVQVSDINSVLAEEKEQWQSERLEMQKSATLAESEITALKAKIEELQAALDILSSEQPGTDTKLATRLAELRYDFEIAKRLNTNQGKEINSLHQQLKDRLQALQQSLLQGKQLKHQSEREKEILKHRIHKLEDELNQSVPRSAADQTCSQLAATTAKYRSLLQTHSLMMQEKNEEFQMETEKQQLLQEREQLSQLLESAREKVHSLQASLNLVGTNSTPVQVALMSKQLAAVELRELAEKQKTEHSTVMYQNAQRECEELHKRVQELEDTINTTSRMNLALQTTEAELRHQLQGAILPQEYQSAIKKAQDLTDENAQLSSHVKHLEAVADVLETQMKQKQLAESVSQIELNQLRQEAQDLASISDERSKIDDLHREVTLLKVKNLQLVSELEESKTMEEKREAEIFRLAQKLRDRERLLETATDTNRARATRLLIIIRDIRQQYAGAVPLSQQEQLAEFLELLRQERNSLQVALHRAQHDKMESQITLRQLKIKQEALDDLKTALSSPKPSSHVSNWCTKLEKAKLRNIELEEKVETLEDTKILHQTQLEGKERRITDLQMQLINLEKMWMDEQLVYDERETELTEALEKYERKHKEAVMNKQTLTLHDVPDAALPISKQLEETLDCLRNKVALLETAESELQKLKDENQMLNKELREKEILVLARDKVISELRQIERMSKEPSSHSLEMQHSIDMKISKNYQTEEESIKVVLTGLKERLGLSQNTVIHYQNLLAKEHEEKHNLSVKFKNELYSLTQKHEEAQARVRDLQSQLDSIPTHDITSSLKQAQAAQIHSLEETVKIVEKQLEEAKIKLGISEKKVVELERDLTLSRREHAEEREHLEVSSQVRIQQHQRELERLLGEIHSVRAERDEMQKEVTLLRASASRTPSAILRTLVEKLRDQLIEKEKQVAKLTLAVNDMKEKIQEQIKTEEMEPINIKEEESQSSKIINSFKEKLEKVTAERDDLQAHFHDQSISLAEVKDKTDAEIEDLKKEIKTHTAENSKIKKLLLQQKSANSSLKQRLEDLEGRSAEAIARTIETLREKLEKMDATEQVQENETRKAKSQEQVIRWEERKKLKGSMDKLKAQVKELETAHNDGLKKLNTSRDLLSRVEKEKLCLQHKINNISKVSTHKMCRVCLKTLNSVDLESGGHGQSLPSFGQHTNRPLRQSRVSPSPERVPVKSNVVVAEKDDSSPSLTRRQQSEQDENEIRFRLQLKKALEQKHSLESQLKEALEEVAALRYRLQQKEEEEERLLTEKTNPTGRRASGAAVVLEYESQVGKLEEKVRQKTRLLSHVKGVVQEAASREEVLLREKETLLQKLTVLESVSEDTPTARLIHELRQAKLTVTRLQRQLDQIQVNS